MITYPGYDPNSPDLKPSPTGGDCMGPEWQDCIVWVDGSAEIRSGDYVQIEVKYSDGTLTHMLKRLEYGAGRWWGTCSDGIFPLCLVQACGIRKVVAVEKMTPMQPPIAVQKIADERTRAYYAMLAAPAIEEWKRTGYRRNVVFGDLETVNRDTSLFPNAGGALQ